MCKLYRPLGETSARRFWVRPTLKARAKYSGVDMLADLNEDDKGLLSDQKEVFLNGKLRFLILFSSDRSQSVQQDTNYKKSIPLPLCEKN